MPAFLAVLLAEELLELSNIEGLLWLDLHPGRQVGHQLM